MRLPPAALNDQRLSPPSVATVTPTPSPRSNWPISRSRLPDSPGLEHHCAVHGRIAQWRHGQFPGARRRRTRAMGRLLNRRPSPGWEYQPHAPAPPPLVWPTQSPSYACSDAESAIPTQWRRGTTCLCVNMPVVCTDPTATLLRNPDPNRRSELYGGHTVWADIHRAPPIQSCTIPAPCSTYHGQRQQCPPIHRLHSRHRLLRQ